MDRQIIEYVHTTLTNEMITLPSKEIVNAVEMKEDMDYDKQQNVTTVKNPTHYKGNILQMRDG